MTEHEFKSLTAYLQFIITNQHTIISQQNIMLLSKINAVTDEEIRTFVNTSNAVLNVQQDAIIKAQKEMLEED